MCAWLKWWLLFYRNWKQGWVSPWGRCSREQRAGENTLKFKVRKRPSRWVQQSWVESGLACLGLGLGPPFISHRSTLSLSLLVYRNEDSSTSQCIGLLSGLNELPLGLAHNSLFIDIGYCHTALWKVFGLPQAMDLREIQQFRPGLKVKRSSQGNLHYIRERLKMVYGFSHKDNVTDPGENNLNEVCGPKPNGSACIQKRVSGDSDIFKKKN